MSGAYSPGQILALQRTVGNAAVVRLVQQVSRGKGTAGAPGRSEIDRSAEGAEIGCSAVLPTVQRMMETDPGGEGDGFKSVYYDSVFSNKHVVYWPPDGDSNDRFKAAVAQAWERRTRRSGGWTAPETNTVILFSNAAEREEFDRKIIDSHHNAEPDDYGNVEIDCPLPYVAETTKAGLEVWTARKVTVGYSHTEDAIKVQHLESSSGGRRIVGYVLQDNFGRRELVSRMKTYGLGKAEYGPIDVTPNQRITFADQ